MLQQDPAKAETSHQELVSIYLKYIDRISEHYHIGLRLFQLYFGFSAGLIALSGVVAKPIVEKYFDNPKDFTIPPAMGWTLIATAVLGIVLAIAWHLVMRDSRKWQLTFNQLLEEWETLVLPSPETGFYHRVNTTYNPKQRLGADVLDVNQWLPLLFGAVWLVVLLTVLWYVSKL